MKFSDIASVAGKGGLFKIVSPTRSGVILEALDESKKRLVTGPQAKVSVLSEIAIFTTDEEGSLPLIDVMRKIQSEFGADTGLTKNSDPDELRSFLKHVLPNYDEERVYVSDLKKLVTWYNKIIGEFPEVLKEETEESTETTAEEASPEKSKSDSAAE